jgi:hypothetical protein
MAHFEVTTIHEEDRPVCEAVTLSWQSVEEILGRKHSGDDADDKPLIEWLLAHGAPAWVETAEHGATDESGWWLIGPEIGPLGADPAGYLRKIAQDVENAGEADPAFMKQFLEAAADEIERLTLKLEGRLN